MYFVYVLENQKTKSLSIDYSSNLKQRISSHLKGTSPTTKKMLPVKSIYFEAYLNRLDAKKRETFLKSGSGRRFLKKQMFNYLSQNNG